MLQKFGHHIYTVKNVQMIEKVQIFALRMCAQDYRLSYEELLETFGLPSLENRRLYVDSTILFVGLLFSLLIYFQFLATLVQIIL